jgi:hypothetical protein
MSPTNNNRRVHHANIVGACKRTWLGPTTIYKVHARRPILQVQLCKLQRPPPSFRRSQPPVLESGGSKLIEARVCPKARESRPHVTRARRCTGSGWASWVWDEISRRWICQDNSAYLYQCIKHSRGCSLPQSLRPFDHARRVPVRPRLVGSAKGVAVHLADHRRFKKDNKYCPRKNNMHVRHLALRPRNVFFKQRQKLCLIIY